MGLPYVHRLAFRVRYSETDQLGTFYNSRALEWFECGRTELLRSVVVSYAEMEHRGVYLPLVEAHVRYMGRARYDDLLEMTSTLSLAGKASLRFDVRIVHAGTGEENHGVKSPLKEKGGSVAEGYTIHAMTDGGGKPVRCPAWLMEALETAGGSR
jgi:acyl-CoA thioester hydrolase